MFRPRWKINFHGSFNDQCFTMLADHFFFFLRLEENSMTNIKRLFVPNIYILYRWKEMEESSSRLYSGRASIDFGFIDFLSYSAFPGIRRMCCYRTFRRFIIDVARKSPIFQLLLLIRTHRWNDSENEITRWNEIIKQCVWLNRLEIVSMKEGIESNSMKRANRKRSVARIYFETRIE